MSKTTIFYGDVMKGLLALDDETVDCIVVSPPYWGLRDYGVPGQLGMEKDLATHLRNMVKVFEECRRVLKPSGTLWLNYGDCYASTPNGRSAAATKAAGNDDRTFRDKPFSTIGAVDKRKRPKPAGMEYQGKLKAKDLCMIPNRLAIALQNAGWYVRSEIIWAKPNAMPESVKDRPATAHEKIFLLTKTPKYYYNAEAVKMPSIRMGDTQTFGGAKASRNPIPETDPRSRGGHEQWGRQYQTTATRSLKNYEPPPFQVWEIATAAFKDAHFATFPPELVERCLLAGCPPGGQVLDPFGGAGTTAMVANQMGLDCHLIELSKDYIKIAWQRIKDDAPLMNDVAVVNGQIDMF